MIPRVVITGIGLLSPLGDRPEQFHDALCAGRSALGPIESFDTDPVPNAQAAEFADFDGRNYIEGNLRPLDRASMLSISAATLALADAGLDPRAGGSEATAADGSAEHGSANSLVLGTMFGSIHTISEFDRRGLVAGPAYVKPLVFANTVINAAAGQAAIRLGLNGINSTLAGGASGLQALGYAADLVRSGRTQVALAGGLEELSLEALIGFRRAGRLAGSDDRAPQSVPYDVGRNGFSLGEGAALLVLETEENAQARGAQVRGVLRGFGQAFDPTRGASAESASAAMARAVALALDDGDLSAEAIGCVFASGNGSTSDLHEGRALAESLLGSRVPVSAIKSMTGETLGGSGAQQAVAALGALEHGQVPGIKGLAQPEAALAALDLSPLVRSPEGPAALITALSLDGAAAALLLTATLNGQGN